MRIKIDSTRQHNPRWLRYLAAAATVIFLEIAREHAGMDFPGNIGEFIGYYVLPAVFMGWLFR